MDWQAIDWDAVGQEAVADLQALLQLNTTNPPGREKIAADWIATRLREDGLEPVLLDSAEDRTNLVCRIEGEEDLAPLLLSAHTDVVPAVGKWTHPPFGGEIHDGFIWGRGAIDMKNMVVMCMWIMKLLARMGKRPKRPVIFAAVADEEAGCMYGSHWLVDNHPELIQAGSVVTEVGGFTLYLQGKRFYPIQVAEKGQVTLKMTARSQGGHGSIPLKQSAPNILAEAVAKLGKRSLPRHVTAAQTRFINAVSAHLPFPLRKIFPLLLTPLGDSILALLPPEQSGPLHASLHNTVSTTIVRAGDKNNVIPALAEATLDGRTLPGHTGADLVREVQAIVGPKLELAIENEQPPVWLDDPFSDLFDLMCKTLRRHDPEGIPVPYMVPGFTDAKAYQRLGMRCYGFAPLQLPPDISFSTLFHGVDERIPVAGFQWGLRVLADTIGAYTGVV
jgi:acetylornithine deacetylase/succinyl-diaminopimelate desuccinylase-like protein